MPLHCRFFRWFFKEYHGFHDMPSWTQSYEGVVVKVVITGWFLVFFTLPPADGSILLESKIVLIFFVEHDLDFPKLQQLFKNIYKIKSYISKCASKNIFRDSFWKISKFYKDSSQKSIFEILTFVKNPYRILRFSKNFQKVQDFQ